MSHKDAKRRDARETLSTGDVRDVVILKTDVDDRGMALTKIENIKTFVRPGKTNIDLADTVRVKIVDVGDSHAEAIAVEKVDGI